MVKCTRVNGRMTKGKVTAYVLIQINLFIKDSGRMTKETAMDSSGMQMGQRQEEPGEMIR
jgi:hypothetical protein